jgi:diaminopropionate ammonia-lyase
VKDESYRFGLNAFKVLGGSYAVGAYIAQRLGRDLATMSFADITSPATKAQTGDITFYTATDGNHGRGVAWAARMLGQKSVVCMPAGSSPTRLANIQAEGATASIVEMNYDDAVRHVNALAQADPNGVMVQDTAWPSYEEIPGWIMQGYSTMAAEADEQLHAAGVTAPTHIFVQAGVGSLAGAVTGYFTNAYANAADKPVITVVEAAAADCLYRSAVAGELTPVGGELATIMAGLACGEGCTISWDILHDHAAFFVSAPDWVAARGMRVLASPLAGDTGVKSGESGAVGLGLVRSIMTEDAYAGLREQLGLGANSQVLCFSTEGDTDPDMYQKIVWDGFCPSYED